MYNYAKIIQITILKPYHYGFNIDPLVSVLKFKHIIRYFSY